MGPNEICSRAGRRAPRLQARNRTPQRSTHTRENGHEQACNGSRCHRPHAVGRAGARAGDAHLGFRRRRRCEPRARVRRPARPSRERSRRPRATARSACSIPAATARSRSPSRSPSTARPARAMARWCSRAAPPASSSTSPTRPMRGAPCGSTGSTSTAWRPAATASGSLSGNLAGTSVVIENTVIDGFTGTRHFGRASQWRQAGGHRHDGQAHGRRRAFASRPGAATRIDATLTNVQVHNSATAALTVERRRQGDGQQFGVLGQHGRHRHRAGQHRGAGRQRTLSGNTTGIVIGGGRDAAALQLQCVVQRDVLNGTVKSYTTNRFIGNGAGGTVTPFGVHTSATGLQ